MRVKRDAFRNEAPRMVVAKDHPDYQKYLKMLKRGLPCGHYSSLKIALGGNVRCTIAEDGYSYGWRRSGNPRYSGRGVSFATR